MTSDSSQQQAPGGVSGIPTAADITAGLESQVPSAAPGGPDNLRMPPNPLAQGTQGSDRDWEASFKGLMKTYQQEKQDGQQKQQAWEAQIQQLSQRMEAMEKPQAPVSPAKPQDTKAPSVSVEKVQGSQQQTGDSDLYDRIAELEAERYRDSLLFQYMQPGQPGHNLPLAMFRDNIPVVAPSVGDDGTLDDKGQKGAIENFIKGLKGIQGQTQQTTEQQMLSGWTPGSAVSQGAPGGNTQDAMLNEYYRLKEYKGSKEYADTDEATRARADAQYWSLHEKVGRFTPGQTTPWMTVDQIGKAINEVRGRIGHLEGFMVKK